MPKKLVETPIVENVTTETHTDTVPVTAEIMTKNVVVKYLVKQNVLHDNIFFKEGDKVDGVPASFLEKEWAERIEEII